jgi:class 3 adenylate cyclase
LNINFSIKSLIKKDLKKKSSNEQAEKLESKKEEKLKTVEDSTKTMIINRMMDGQYYSDNSMPNASSNTLVDLQTLVAQRKDRFCQALKERYQYNTSIRRGQDFLLKHVNSRMELVVMYADLVGSTKMSMTLPAEQMVTIIRAFSHELSSVIESHNGFVLKYVGDAVISFFPPGFAKILVSDKSVQCGKSMINTINKGLNPILKNCDYPELAVRIGIDVGENLIVQYGYDKSSPIDIICYCMNVTAKITSLTGSNKVSVGENVYKLLHPETQPSFIEVINDDKDWKYIDRESGNLYKFYTMK